MKTKTKIQAGGLDSRNHNQSLRVKSTVKAGALGSSNHNQSSR